MTRPNSEDQYLRSFGRHLAALREERGMSQEKLGALAGVSRETVGLMERGQRWARLSTLHQVAKALGVATKELFDSLQQ